VFRKWGTNAKIFRFFAAGIGLFGGASLAVAMADGAALQGLLLAVLAVAGFFSGWFMQNIGAGLLLADSRKRKMSLLCASFWLVFGALAGDMTTAFYMVVGLFLSGILLCWGGRRTREGRRVLAELMGLRGYLRKNPQKNVLMSQQDYFFSMLPWAISLGCGAQFTKNFGKVKFENCDYLFFGVDKVTTPWQWYRLFTQTLTDMNRRADNLPLEKFFGILQSVTRR
jgi:MFS family permease